MLVESKAMASIEKKVADLEPNPLIAPYPVTVPLFLI